MDYCHLILCYTTIAKEGEGNDGDEGKGVGNEESDVTDPLAKVLDVDDETTPTKPATPHLVGLTDWVTFFNRYPGKVAYMRPKKKALRGD